MAVVSGLSRPPPPSLAWNLALSTLLMDALYSQVPSQP